MRISFRDVFQFLLRGLLPALAVGAVAAVVAFFLTKDPVPVYRATAVLLATRPGVGFYNEVNVIEPTQVDPDIYRSAIVQGGLLEQTLAGVLGHELTSEQLAEWRRLIRVRVNENLISGLLHIDVDNEDPEVAVEVADSLANALLAWDRDRVIRNVQATVTSLSQTILILGAQISTAEAAGDEREVQLLRSTRDQRLSQLRAAEALNLSAVVMGLLEPFRSAVVDPNPVNSREVFVAAIAFVLFFILVYAVLFLLRVADPRIRNEEDLADGLGIPATAVIPVESQTQKFKDAIERLATWLLLTWQETKGEESQVVGSGRVVTVTSPTNAGERSQLARHLATAFSDGGWRVLLVDADLKEGRISKAVPGTRQGTTMAQLVRDTGKDEPAKLSGDGSKLRFIPAGDTPVEGSAMHLGRSVGKLVDGWRKDYQIVVIDSSALEQSPATVSVARESDTVVLAVAKATTLIRKAEGAALQLRGGAGSAHVATVLTAGSRRSGARRLMELVRSSVKRPASTPPSATTRGK